VPKQILKNLKTSTQETRRRYWRS